LSLLGVVSPSLMIHGRVGLNCVGAHTRALRVLQVLSSSPAAGVVAAMMAGPSSSSTSVAEPSSKKARPWSFLSVSSRYAHGVLVG
jgi:hypothetical protein